MKALINLPFNKTEKDIKPNMITIMKKDNVNYILLQIYHEPNEDYTFSIVQSPCMRIDFAKFNLNGTSFIKTNNYTIELTCEEDFVDPINYQ